MKTTAPAIAIAFVLILGGCTRPGLGPENGEDRPSKGVSFTISTMAPATRTALAPVEGDTGKDRIDWIGGDWIRIYSPQASVNSGSKGAPTDYYVASIVTSDDRLSSRGSLYEVDPDKYIALSNAATHDFYAFYPSPDAVRMQNDNNNGGYHPVSPEEPLFGSGDAKPAMLTGADAGKASFPFSASQKTVLREGTGETVSPGVVVFPVYEPDMRYAPMVAVARDIASDAASIPLSFYPAFTVYQIIVRTMDNDVRLTAVSLTTSDDNTVLSGTVTGTMNSVTGSNATPFTITSIDNPGNTVALDLSGLDGQAMTIAKGMPATFYLLAPPKEATALTLNLTGYFGSTTLTTRSLKLQKRDAEGQMQWITFEPFKKHNIGTINTPVTLDAGGEDIIVWDVKPLTDQWFTVSSTGKRVRFTSSNLMYAGNTFPSSPWRLMEYPWIVTAENANTTPAGFAQGVDFGLFPWASASVLSGNENDLFIEGTDLDYGPSIISGEWFPASDWDWGVHTVRTYDGLEQFDGLRTLSADEWTYLMEKNNGQNCGYGRIVYGTQETYGMILIPDNFVLPSDLSFYHDSPNTYSVGDFVRLAAAGAVFLPVAGYYKQINGQSVSPEYLSPYAAYWSSTAALAQIGTVNCLGARAFIWNSTDGFSNDPMPRSYRFSVRLVKDETAPVEEHPALFSVSASKRVIFARGNLMMLRADAFAFTGYQWRYDEVATPGYGFSHFGWSPLTNWPANTSSVSTDYANSSEAFNDWGTLIGDYAGWRTLTQTEWEYIFTGRPDAANKWARATITYNNKDWKGVVLLPDNWAGPGLAATAQATSDNFTLNNYDEVAKWLEMERYGAVFLPFAGNRGGDSNLIFENVEEQGFYHSSTYGSANPYILQLRKTSEPQMSALNKRAGRSVRLVRDYTE